MRVRVIGITVEPLSNEVIRKTNEILRASKSKIYGKNLDIKKPHYSEHVFSSPLALRYIKVLL